MAYRLNGNDFNQFIEAVHAHGYLPVLPTVHERAIVYREGLSAAGLPQGWSDQQAPGQYSLVPSPYAKSLFRYTVGPDSWKRFFRPAERRLWQAQKKNGQIRVSTEATDPAHKAPRLALIGVRPCELAAIHRQDKILREGSFVDPDYVQRREACLVVAVQCTYSVNTCFCPSFNAGPNATQGFDIAITEIVNEQIHFFTLQAGSPDGEKILNSMQLAASAPEEDFQVDAALAQCRRDIEKNRQLESDVARQNLKEAHDHAHWQSVAQRCLSCANCTMVCPTCFCTTVEERSSLEGDIAERWQLWDSCFHEQFSYLHGGAVRRSTASRYRQWLTHKLSSWYEQFSTSGCVGCGRCITWCPVGIDLTEEVKALTNKVVTTTSMTS